MDNVNPEAVFSCKEEADLYLEELDRVQFHTKYNFLKAHNGFRKGNMHTFLGTSGGGKSTLTRSLMIDMFQNFSHKEDKILLWLSEERSKDYIAQLHKTGMPFELINRIIVYSEVDENGKNRKDVIKRLDWIISEHKPMAVFYDNITTSMEYATVTIPEQDKFYHRLKTLALNSDIPFLIMAHTNGKITENYEHLIDQNDIRGSKQPAMISEFFYILQAFYVNEVRHNTIRLTKFRGSSVEHRLYMLDYKKEMQLFVTDRKLEFEGFKEIFKTRNTLK